MEENVLETELTILSSNNSPLERIKYVISREVNDLIKFKAMQEADFYILVGKCGSFNMKSLIKFLDQSSMNQKMHRFFLIS